MTERKRILKGNRLRQIRERRDLSQEELALRLGIGQSQLARYESEKADPSLEVIARFARELEVSIDWLLGLADTPEHHVEEKDLSAREWKAISALRRGDLREYMRVGSEETEPEH